MTTPLNQDCCDYQAGASRRSAMKTALGLGAGLAVASVFGSAFVETAYAATGHADRMLVVLSMRGAADGMSLMVPHGDPVYYQARPGISIPKSSLLVGDSMFGMHPAFAPLVPMWNAGKIAAIHATGQIVTTRSHFAAMEEVEDADPGSAARVGWLNRLISLREGGPSNLTGLQLGDTVLATQLAGSAPALSAPGLDRLSLAGPDGEDAARWERALATLWAGAPSQVASGGGSAIAVAKAFAPARNSAASSVVYPRGDLGEALASTARVLKSDIGAEVVTLDHGSWDHHQWVGNVNDGNVKRMAEPLFASLAAFFQDLGPLADRVTVVTISEFGRRVKENANQGLDHGHGNVMFAMGAGVKGGYYGRWPGVQNTADADLPVTTDYRDVLSEVVGKLYPERSLSTIFPQFSHTGIGFMAGVLPPVTDPEDPTDPDEPDTPTPPVTPVAMPAAFVSRWSSMLGKSKVGAKVTAPMPVLSAAGKRAGVTASYRFETVKSGRVTKRGSGRSVRIPKSWRGLSLQVRVTLQAKNYKPMVKVFKWGRVKSA